MIGTFGSANATVLDTKPLTTVNTNQNVSASHITQVS